MDALLLKRVGRELLSMTAGSVRQRGIWPKQARHRQQQLKLSLDDSAITEKIPSNVGIACLDGDSALSRIEVNLEMANCIN